MDTAQLYLKQKIKCYEDFPSKGVNYLDIMPIFSDLHAIDLIVQYFVSIIPKTTDLILAPEMRGALVASYVCAKLRKPLVIARKPNKLPGEVFQFEYQTEYSMDKLEVQTNAISEKQKVFIIDDVAVTGGTLQALLKICDAANAPCVGIGCLIVIEVSKSLSNEFNAPFANLLTYT